MSLTFFVTFYTFARIAKRNPQLELLKKQKDSYGGELLKTREGRMGPRPIATRDTMHFVLRSSKAVGDWSFKKPKNERKIEQISTKFSTKYGIKIVSLANVGTHLHFQFKIVHRLTYKPFIRAITAAIAMAVTGASRWNRLKIKFWDYRPFSRVVRGYRAFLNLKDYIQINQLEGFGASRAEARFIIADSQIRPWKYNSG
jgi:putative transposase